MSTSEDNASTKPANNHDGMTSERARSIARRAFLRKSVGVAAPVVMTLQSGPAAAVQSITCQHKTPTDNGVFNITDAGTGKVIHPLSGFNNTPSIPGIDKLQENDAVEFAGQTPEDPTSLDSTGNRLTANDGFARCTDTSTTTGPNDGSNAWTQDGGTTTYGFNGPDGSFDPSDPLSPTLATGPVSMHTIGPDGEDQFAGCYGDAGVPADARPLTCSCWSSLHPGP